MKRSIEVVVDGQRFMYLGEDLNGSGTLYRYAGRCATCGEIFEQAVRGAAAAAGNLVRRCLQHRGPSTIDPTALHPDCRRPLPRPAQSSAPRPRSMFKGDEPIFSAGEVIHALVKHKSLERAMRSMGVRDSARIAWVRDRLLKDGWIEKSGSRGAYVPTRAAIKAADLPPPKGMKWSSWPGPHLNGGPGRLTLKFYGDGHPPKNVVVTREVLQKHGTLSALLLAEGVLDRSPADRLDFVQRFIDAGALDEWRDAGESGTRGRDAPPSRTANATEWADQTSTEIHGGDLDRRSACEGPGSGAADSALAEIDGPQDA